MGGGSVTPTTLPALRALALPHASAHARDVLARPWSAADQAALVIGEDAVRAVGGEPAPREEIEG